MSDASANTVRTVAAASITSGGPEKVVAEDPQRSDLEEPNHPSEKTHSATAPPAVESQLGWRRGDQIVFGTLVIAVLALMIMHWARMSGWGIRAVEIERQQPRAFEYRLDVNSATWVEWTQLDGIGDQLARRIVEDREMHGPFQTIDDLERVPGIGPKTLEKLRPWLAVVAPPAFDSRAAVDRPQE